MIYLVCFFAILAIVNSLILIDIGILDRDRLITGIGSFILAVVLVVGGCFYAGIKSPLIVLCLVIGSLMCYSSCKGIASCSKSDSYSTSDKVIGSVCWGISILLLSIAFYYWYYVPEYNLLVIVMGLIAMIAFVYAMYCTFTGRSSFLSSMTAFIFASIVYYFGEILGIQLHWTIYYLMLAISGIVGILLMIKVAHIIIPWFRWKFKDSLKKDLVSSPFLYFSLFHITLIF